MLKGNSEDKW